MSSTQRFLKVRACVYTEPGKLGDFNYMSNPDKFKAAGRCCFIYNGNVVDEYEIDKNTLPHKGAGTACVRPESLAHQPHQPGKSCSFGISTGWTTRNGGFKGLSQLVKRSIDFEFEHLYNYLCSSPKVEFVVFSAERISEHVEEDKRKQFRLGCNVFDVPLKILDYITHKINELENIDFNDASVTSDFRSYQEIRRDQSICYEHAKVHYDMGLEIIKLKKTIDEMKAKHKKTLPISSSISKGHYQTSLFFKNK